MALEGKPDFDVVVIGGGPAGLAAATTLRQLGIGSVAIIEREAEVGGIPRHCGHYPFGMREFRRALKGPDYARRLVERAQQHGVSLMPATTVLSLLPGPRLAIAGAVGIGEISAARVLLATGVRETSRAARLIGGTKPGGVVSTGALQGLVYLAHDTPFRRPVVLGSELVSFSALLTCRHAGIKPMAMVEPNARITAFAASAALPRLLRVPLLLATRLERIFGDAWVEAVELIDAEGKSRVLETDGVIVSGQFVPEAALLRDSHLSFDAASGGPEIDQFGRCSDPDYFAAGNLLRAVETAGWSWSEGVRAGRAIAASLTDKLPSAQPAVRLAVRGDALKYAVPQRWVVTAAGGSNGASESSHQNIQFRVKRPVRGQICLSVGGEIVWSRSQRGLPERRILVPHSALPRYGGTEVDVSLTDEN